MLSLYLYYHIFPDHQDKFEYLNLGQSPDIDKVSDKDQFKETIQAMHVLGFDARQVGVCL